MQTLNFAEIQKEFEHLDAHALWGARADQMEGLDWRPITGRNLRSKLGTGFSSSLLAKNGVDFPEVAERICRYIVADRLWRAKQPPEVIAQAHSQRQIKLADQAMTSGLLGAVGYCVQESLSWKELTGDGALRISQQWALWAKVLRVVNATT